MPARINPKLLEKLSEILNECVECPCNFVMRVDAISENSVELTLCLKDKKDGIVTEQETVIADVGSEITIFPVKETKFYIGNPN